MPQISRRIATVAWTLAIAGSLLPALRAQGPSLATGVFSAAQAGRGQSLYEAQCAGCHGAALGGGLAPPLAGAGFNQTWGGKSLADLAEKIRKTMPEGDPGKLTPEQTSDLVAHILQTDKFPAGKSDLPVDQKALAALVIPGQPASSVAKGPAVSFPPVGNLAQLMRGIMFPSSNMIFNVQTNDPGAPPPASPGPGANQSFSWVDWGAGIYKGWDIVDYAAIAVAESAPLMLTPGRRCENGKPVPVDRPDWIKFTQEMAEAGRAAYRASQTRNQEAVSEVTNQLADSCLHCHQVYRDKRGRGRTNTDDPSNKAARCTP